jgi:hypothetical protein
MAGLLVVISPARPLWPANWFCERNSSWLQTTETGKRAIAVYGVYRQRPNIFEPAVKLLPADAAVVGFVSYDDPETSLWRPFSSRRILHVRPGETGKEIRQRGIRYVLVKEEELREPWEQWLRRTDARLLDSVGLRERASRGPYVWHLVELN